MERVYQKDPRDHELIVNMNEKLQLSKTIENIRNCADLGQQFIGKSRLGGNTTSYLWK